MMYGGINNKKHIRIAIALAIFFIALFPCYVLAEGKTGSLEICYRVSDGGKVTNIDGAVFGIKRVTDYEGKLPSEGNKEQVNLLKLSAEETALLAEELSKGRDDWDIQGTTDKDGIIRFPDLETGIYLVTQTGGKGMSHKCETAKPFLISVPSEEGYDVVCYPKTTILKDKVNPKTGDEMGLRGETVLLISSVMLLVGLLISRSEEGGSKG
ncbi:MAG: hypothetical protein II018_01280 [Firmicutes bacterium]|nr:hypothetical protein [Bacillota bacterium]